MYKKIVITGGSGFVGSNLAVYLKQKLDNVEIICMDNLKRRGSELNLSRLKENGINFIHGDIRNYEDLEELPNFDLMIECSAEPSVMAGINSSPRYLINTNLLGTINCLEVVRKNSADIIFLSTSRVYPIESINNLKFVEDETRFTLDFDQELIGVSEKGINESFPLTGVRSLYGTTKLCSELLILEYAASYGIKSIINRCGLITGPWQMGKVDQGVISLWVLAHIFNKKLKYIGYGGTGKQVRDVLHISDLCRLVLIEVNNIDRYSGDVFNAGGGLKNSISLLELTALCQEITGNIVPIESIHETRPNDLIWYVTDNSRISEVSGWKPKKTLRDTISDLTAWILIHRKELSEVL